MKSDENCGSLSSTRLTQDRRPHKTIQVIQDQKLTQSQSRHRVGTEVPGYQALGPGGTEPAGPAGPTNLTLPFEQRWTRWTRWTLHKLHIVTPLYTFYFTQHQNLKGVPRRQFMQFIVNLKTLKARCVQVCMNIKQRKWIEDGSELHILRNSASLRHCSNRSGLQLAASSFQIFSRFFQRYLMLPHVSSSCCLMSVMCRLCICTFGTFGTFGTFP